MNITEKMYRKQLRGTMLVYEILETEDRIFLKIRYGKDSCFSDFLPTTEEQRGLPERMFQASVTPCCAAEILEDFRCHSAAVSEKSAQTSLQQEKNVL